MGQAEGEGRGRGRGRFRFGSSGFRVPETDREKREVGARWERKEAADEGGRVKARGRESGDRGQGVPLARGPRDPSGCQGGEGRRVERSKGEGGAQRGKGDRRVQPGASPRPRGPGSPSSCAWARLPPHLLPREGRGTSLPRGLPDPAPAASACPDPGRPAYPWDPGARSPALPLFPGTWHRTRHTDVPALGSPAFGALTCCAPGRVRGAWRPEARGRGDP